MMSERTTEAPARELSGGDLEQVRAGGSPFFDEGGTRLYVSRAFTPSGEDADGPVVLSGPVPGS